ncbi:MAG: DUF5592 family protein [Anaerovoracaceae bacterium]
MKYIVTEDITSPNKVAGPVTVFDFFFVGVYMGVSFVLLSGVHSSLKIPFLIFSLLMAIFLTSRSYFNKKRRNYESLILLLKNETEVYRPFMRGEKSAKR